MTDDAPPPNSLPVLVTAPGDYVTRDGRRVTIREVREGSPGTTSFGATGAVWREMRGVCRPRGFEIWHVSGRHMVLRETALDIVGSHPGS